MAPTSPSDPGFPIQLYIRILEYFRYIARRRPWRKPAEMTTPHEDRLALVQSAIDVSLQEKNLGPNGQFVYDPTRAFWGYAGWLYGQMAELDGASNPNTNETKYRYPEMIADYFAKAEGDRAGFASQYLDGGLGYGRSAIIAYQIYNDERFLEFALKAWRFGRTWTITEADVAKGRFAAKGTDVARSCSGSTVAGGTFRSSKWRDAGINVLATGNFFVLSALLAEATQDDEKSYYLDWATTSLTFLKNHLFLPEKNQVLDSFDSVNCRVVNHQVHHNYGLVIQGLAILYSITGNASLQIMLNDVISVGIRKTEWHSKDGIIAAGSERTGSVELVHGLTAAYERNATSPELRQVVARYLTVQFNAVKDLSTFPGTNIYSSQWVGPASSSFSGRDQTTALSVLLASLSLPLSDSAMIINPTRQIVAFGFILFCATVLVVGVVQFFWPQLGRLVKRALWLSLVPSSRRLQRLFGVSVRLKWAEEEEEDSESMGSIPLQDGVYQLDGRIVQEDQYPIAVAGNANIYRGTLSRSDGRKIPVAIKVLRQIGDYSEHQATLRRMEREVQVWSRVKHPNLLPFFGICKGLAQWPVLVYPFYELGHVGEYLKKLPEADRQALTVGAATGLTYLHSREMIHGNLKVQNVLVDASGRAVICDFGLSKIIDQSGYTTSCVGTVAYMAPELFTVLDNDNPRGARTTKATDVYSFGLLGLEIYASQRPKRRPTSPIVTKQTLVEMQPKREDVPVDTVPPVLWYLFERCWHPKPHLRPTMTHVLRSLEAFGRSLSRQRKRKAQNSGAGPSTAAVSTKTTYRCRFDRPQSCSFEVDDFVPTDAPTLADRHTLYWIPETNEWTKMEDGLTPRILDEVERGKYAEAVEACRVNWAWDDPDVNDEL